MNDLRPDDLLTWEQSAKLFDKIIREDTDKTGFVYAYVKEGLICIDGKSGDDFRLVMSRFNHEMKKRKAKEYYQNRKTA